MRIWGIGQISPSEKDEILSKHKEMYNGYQTLYPNQPNTQPLYTFDSALDKGGLVVNNKGEVKPYTNFGINESTDKQQLCSECGGQLMEGECMECGWKNESIYENTCQECGSQLMEGECMECGWKQSDLDPDLGFDYIEGESNKVDVFEEKIRTVEIPMNELTSNAPLSYGKHYDEIEEPFNFRSNGPVGDGGTLRQKSLEEAGYTGGGNAPVPDEGSDAFDFISGGPKEDTYTQEADDMDLDIPKEKKPYNFISQGAEIGDVFPVNEDECEECWEKMESAWNEEIDEVDVSGSQGVYGSTKKPFAFVSDGPGKGGPYQEHSWGGHEMEEGYEGEDEDVYWKKDLEPNELDVDLEKFNPYESSWEEITAYTGEDEFSHLDEELKESLDRQKNKINEMFLRMKRYN